MNRRSAGSSALAGLMALTAAAVHAQDASPPPPPPQYAAPAQGAAPAGDTAKINPFASETVTYDDNVFRISNQVNPATVTGYTTRGDTFFTTSAGVTADVPVSLQRFDLSLTYNGQRYDTFHVLDFDGYDLRGSWLWQVGRNLSGEIGVTYTDSLAPFAELLSVTPDRFKVREEFAKGSWLITPDWKLFADADQLVQTNSVPADLYNDVTVNSVEASFSRLIGPANWLGIDARFESGSFPYGEAEGTQLIDNGYDQYSYGLVLDWGAETPSHVVARVDQVNRRYDELSQRDFDFTTAHLEYTWTPTAKVAVVAVAERDISPYEYVHSSIVLVKGITLEPVWHATGELDVSAHFAAVSRTYLSDPGETLGLELNRDDQVHTAGAMVSYHPYAWLLVQLSATHEERTSNISGAFGGYVDNVYWLKARLSLY
jgi:exopolysaccharide biosynthesis operon protein EpsL